VISAPSQLTLSLVTAPTVNLTVKAKCNNENGLYFWMERQTAVRMEEIISIHDKIIYKRQNYWKTG